MNTNTDTRPLSPRKPRLWQSIMIFAFAVFALTMNTACKSPIDNTYGAGSDGKTITVEKGKVFNMCMLVNNQTDAKWQVVEVDNSIIEQMGPPMYMMQIPAGGLPRISNYNFVFRGIKEGTTTLKLIQTLPGQDDPIETVTTTVNVVEK
jgi:hypothetical protein